MAENMDHSSTYFIPVIMKMYLLAAHEPIKCKKSNCKKVTKGKQPQLMILVLTGTPQRGRLCILLLYTCTLYSEANILIY
jgi:hypothetical protein